MTSEPNGDVLLSSGGTDEAPHVVNAQLGGLVRVPDVPQLHGAPDVVPGVKVHVLHGDLVCGGIGPVHNVLLIDSERHNDFQTIILQFEPEILKNSKGGYGFFFFYLIM